MLAALAYWGFTVGDGAGAWVLGVGAPLLAAVVWRAWVAPKAGWPVPIPTRVVIELVLFGAAVGGLAVAGQPLAAVVLASRGSLPRCSTPPRNARRATDHQVRNRGQADRRGADPPEPCHRGGAAWCSRY